MIGQKQIETERTVKNASLEFCTHVAQSVKTPQSIPFYDVYTYDLLSRYFCVKEKRVMNAYRGHRRMFENDCCTLSGKQIATKAKDFQDLGVSRGRICLFPDGTMTTVMYGINMVFNARALVMFSLILRDESDVANDIANEFERLTKHSFGIPYQREYKPTKPWFLATEAPTQEVERFECPLGFCPPADKAYARVDQDSKAQAVVSVTDKARDIRRGGHKPREVLQIRNGKVVHRWESATQASKVLGISVQSIYNCCRGTTKKTRKGGFGFEYPVAQ